MVLTLFALPLLLMSAIYLRIFIIISRHQKGRRLNHERSTLTRGMMSAAIGTAAAVNLPELMAKTDAAARCAACTARAMQTMVDTDDVEDPTISILAAETVDDHIVDTRLQFDRSRGLNKTDDGDNNAFNVDGGGSNSLEAGNIQKHETTLHRGHSNHQRMPLKPLGSNVSSLSQSSVSLGRSSSIKHPRNHLKHKSLQAVNSAMTQTTKNSSGRSGSTSSVSSSSSSSSDGSRSCQLSVAASKLPDQRCKHSSTVTVDNRAPVVIPDRRSSVLFDGSSGGATTSSYATGKPKVACKDNCDKEDGEKNQQVDKIELDLTKTQYNPQQDARIMDNEATVELLANHSHISGSCSSGSSSSSIDCTKSNKNSFTSTRQAIERGFIFLIKPIMRTSSKQTSKTRQYTRSKFNVAPDSTAHLKAGNDFVNDINTDIKLNDSTSDEMRKGSSTKTVCRVGSKIDCQSKINDLRQEKPPLVKSPKVPIKSPAGVTRHKTSLRAQFSLGPVAYDNNRGQLLSLPPLQSSGGLKNRSRFSPVKSPLQSSTNSQLSLDYRQQSLAENSTPILECTCDNKLRQHLTSSSSNTTTTTTVRGQKKGKSVILSRSNTIATSSDRILKGQPHVDLVGPTKSEQSATKTMVTLSTSQGSSSISSAALAPNTTGIQPTQSASLQQSHLSGMPRSLLKSVKSTSLSFTSRRQRRKLLRTPTIVSSVQVTTTGGDVGQTNYNYSSIATNAMTNVSQSTATATYEPQRRHLHASAVPQTNTKALVTTLLILGTYFISYVPAIIYQVLTCIDNCPYPLYDISFSRRVLLGAMTTLLLIAKSIIDPFIYSYRMSEIQVAIRRYLSKRRSKTSMGTM